MRNRIECPDDAMIAQRPERKRGCTNWAAFTLVLVVGLSLVLAGLWLRKAAEPWDAPRTWTTPEAEDGK